MEMWAWGRAGILAAVPLCLLVLSGCGGGEGKATTDTGTTDGHLSSVQISPPPGSTFISKYTKFYLTWTQQDPPPPTFTAALERYTEATEDTDGGSDTQKTVLTRVAGDGYVWEVSRKDDYGLDDGGVYYLQLEAGAEEVDAAYIVTNDGRAAAAATQAEKDGPAVPDAGAAGALRHLVVTGTK